MQFLCFLQKLRESFHLCDLVALTKLLPGHNIQLKPLGVRSLSFSYGRCSNEAVHAIYKLVTGWWTYGASNRQKAAYFLYETKHHSSNSLIRDSDVYIYLYVNIYKYWHRLLSVDVNLTWSFASFTSFQDLLFMPKKWHYYLLSCGTIQNMRCYLKACYQFHSLITKTKETDIVFVLFSITYASKHAPIIYSSCRSTHDIWMCRQLLFHFCSAFCPVNKGLKDIFNRQKDLTN